MGSLSTWAFKLPLRVFKVVLHRSLYGTLDSGPTPVVQGENYVASTLLNRSRVGCRLKPSSYGMPSLACRRGEWIL
jgi:hypothetical protein